MANLFSEQQQESLKQLDVCESSDSQVEEQAIQDCPGDVGEWVGQ